MPRPRTLAAVLAALVLLAALGHGGSAPQGLAAGPLYPVAEPDLLEHIEAAAATAAADLEQARATARAYLAAPPPVPGLVAATRTHATLFDPTVRLARAVVAADGTTLHAAGTPVNPLDHVRLEGRLVVFDARDPAQAAFAARLLAGPGRTRAILTGGSPVAFAHQAGGRRAYFDQDGQLSRRLGLRELPAVVTQAGKRLRVDTVALGR